MSSLIDYSKLEPKTTPYRAMCDWGFEVEGRLWWVIEQVVEAAVSATANRFAVYYGSKRVAWIKGNNYGILAAAKRIKEHPDYTLPQLLDKHFHKQLKKHGQVSCKVIKVKLGI